MKSVTPNAELLIRLSDQNNFKKNENWIAWRRKKVWNENGILRENILTQLKIIIENLSGNNDRNTEAVAQRCSVKKVLLEVSQNSQENTCAQVTLAQVLSCEFWKISKNTSTPIKVKTKQNNDFNINSSNWQIAHSTKNSNRRKRGPNNIADGKCGWCQKMQINKYSIG